MESVEVMPGLVSGGWLWCMQLFWGLELLVFILQMSFIRVPNSWDVSSCLFII